MTAANRLSASQLRWQCDADQFKFQTTSELEDLQQILGQARGLDAVQFGISISRDGYNMYVLGPPGLGKRTTLKHFLSEKAAKEPPPDDWCYVYNFEQADKPRAIRLPAGRGVQFQRDVASLVTELKTSIPAMLEHESHQNRVQAVEQEAKERHDRAFKELADKALENGIQLVRTPGGFAMAALRNGEVIGPEQFEQLSPEERARIEVAVQLLQEEMKELIEKVPRWRVETREKVKALNREMTSMLVGGLLVRLRAGYDDIAGVLSYFDVLERDIVDNSEDFQPKDESPRNVLGIPVPEQPAINRYGVNLLVDNSRTVGAPVVYENHPSYHNLMGRAEYESRMGTLVTQFMLLKPGALHMANGGYLVLDALKVLEKPYAWEGLKRALTTRELRIESLGESLSLISTVSLEPQPIPLEIKIILVGDRRLYYMLHEFDRDFAELFKVAADFDEQMDRTDENCQLYARYIATMARQESYVPFNRHAVASVIEHSARLAGDSEKLSTSMQSIANLLREADYWAKSEDAPLVTARHVDLAIEKQIYRADRVRHGIYEAIQRGTVLIDTGGACVGQVNGLSVIQMGDFAFGQPSRITATARLGKGEVVDIEREVKLGGSIHTKGVLILSSFLANRFAQTRPLSLSASLAFEQSYGMVDGDSASVAELCALLSALSGIPIRQSLAVTGSVNQRGQVQPIGGANAKIEGFFDVCSARGLTGEQGVLIPSTNVRHLMLRKDVVAAVEAGQFHVYAVETVDEAISLLTGVPAGEPDEQGAFPAGTVNHGVAARLDDLFRIRQQLNQESGVKSPS
ncbi:MAG: ATP-dependent protease [Planctomycetes bacterium]|nr:ATP-dependent protease [Planctomycetota bacterium]